MAGGGEGGIDSSLRSSPFGRTSCVQIGCADLSNPLVYFVGSNTSISCGLPEFTRRGFHGRWRRGWDRLVAPLLALRAHFVRPNRLCRFVEPAGLFRGFEYLNIMRFARIYPSRFSWPVAERVGFEPTKGYEPLPVFKTGAFDRSATSPVAACDAHGIVLAR
jgi:hypothetical protein